MQGSDATRLRRDFKTNMANFNHRDLGSHRLHKRLKMRGQCRDLFAPRCLIQD